jgi:hypothetical protein
MRMASLGLKSTDLAHRATGRQLVPELSHSLLQDWVLHIRRDLREWLQNEAPAMHGGMRDAQIFILDYFFPKKNQIDVNVA